MPKAFDMCNARPSSTFISEFYRMLLALAERNYVTGMFARCCPCTRNHLIDAHVQSATTFLHLNCICFFIDRCQSTITDNSGAQQVRLLSGLLYVHHAWSEAGV